MFGSHSATPYSSELPTRAEFARGIGGGFLGVRGDTGDRGQQGERGDPGYQGKPGEPGSPGDRGAPGPQGDRGQRGERGDTGDRGEGRRGPPGDIGATGPAGPAGPAGLAGSAGSLGTVDATAFNAKIAIMEARLAALEIRSDAGKKNDVLDNRVSKYAPLLQTSSRLVDDLGKFHATLHVQGIWNQQLHDDLRKLQRDLSDVTTQLQNI